MENLDIIATGLYFLVVGIIGESYNNYLKDEMGEVLPAMLIMIPIYVGAWFLYFLLKGLY